MTVFFRIFLVFCAFAAWAFVMFKIRKSEIKIADSTFWFLFVGSILLFAVVPQVPSFISRVLTIESPSNFVFMYLIAVLIVRLFTQTVQISKLQARVETLTQEKALDTAGAPRDGLVGGPAEKDGEE